MTTVVIAPHPDDETIGCGGSLLLLTKSGERVVTVFLTSGELGLRHLPREEAWHVRECEARAAAARLGTVDPVFLRMPDWYVGENLEETAAKLRDVFVRERPDCIYLPHPAEWHPDHRASLAVCRLSLADWHGPIPALHGYEVWTPLASFDHIRDISPVVRHKMAAIRCYASQLAFVRYDRAIRGLNQYRGALAGHAGYAEVFDDLVLEPPCCESVTGHSEESGDN